MIRNEKGQVLVLFVVLLPVIFLALSYVIDLGLMKLEKNKLDNLNEMVITYVLEHPDMNNTEIKDFIKKNDKNIKFIDITYNKSLKIKLVKDYKSVFVSILGEDKYELVSFYEGVTKKDDIKISNINEKRD